jgi:hypothetical protein
MRRKIEVKRYYKIVARIGNMDEIFNIVKYSVKCINKVICII